MNKDFFTQLSDFRTAACVCCHKRRKYHEFSMITSATVGVCKNCMEGIGQTRYGSSFEGSRYVSYILSPLEYNESAREMVKGLKFLRNTLIADIFDEMFGEFLAYYDHLSEFDMVVSVPLSKERLMVRGYNQADYISQIISRHIDVPVLEPVARIKHTKRQSGLSAQKRFYNVMDAFKSDDSVCGKRIILVDDVRTTGNTMDNCAKAMIEKGAIEVIGITATITVPKFKISY